MTVLLLFQVKYWITINEPRIITGGLGGTTAESGINPYRSMHNLIKAHAEAYHVYDRKQNGKEHTLFL